MNVEADNPSRQLATDPASVPERLAECQAAWNRQKQALLVSLSIISRKAKEMARDLAACPSHDAGRFSRTSNFRVMELQWAVAQDMRREALAEMAEMERLRRELPCEI